jgi:hypothetical protein
MKSYISLLPKQQHEVCARVSETRNLHESAVDKDFWICWTLRALFTLPECDHALTFKGGTSLFRETVYGRQSVAPVARLAGRYYDLHCLWAMGQDERPPRIPPYSSVSRRTGKCTFRGTPKRKGVAERDTAARPG